MYGYRVLFIWILQHFVLSTVDGCAETIIISPAEMQEGRNVRLRCGYTACLNVNKMVFEKKDAGGNDNWREAVLITIGNAKEYNTLLNEYNLASRSDSQVTSGVFDLIISSTEQVDSGWWRCKVLADGGPHEGNEAELRVIVPLLDVDLQLTRTPADAKLVLTALYEYTCTSNKHVYPAADVIFEVDGKSVCENKAIHEPKGYLFSFISKCPLRSNTTDEITVRCTVRRNVGTTWSASTDISPGVDNVVFPAYVEDGNLSSEVVEISSTLVMYCIATGEDVSIEWTQNDEALNNTLFDRKQENVSGDFKYGQKVGLKDTLTWKNPTTTDPCSNITRHDGTYVCVVNGLANTVSDKRLGTVTIHYKPAVNTDGLNPEIKEGEELQIDCPACANPGITSYQWSIMNGNLREGITGETTSTLNIPKVTKEDIDSIYVCAATNEIGTTQIEIDIKALIVGLSTGAIVGIVFAVLVVVGALIGVPVAIYCVKKDKSKNKGNKQ